jgi:4-hydroxy-tetrahydrodipicolinate synthase
MANKKEIQGCGTALVTPFTRDGSLDEEALRRLVDFQISNGIDFLVPCGTTGENPTLTAEEHVRVVEIVVGEANGRVPVVAGAGGYDTRKVIETANKVKNAGADAILSVTPYYNKPTQAGLIAHYSAIAGAVDAPIIMYNVPGRTSTNLLPETVVKLARVQGIIGIKEASGNIGQIEELAVKVPPDFKIISGDDAITLPMIALGGVGVISVVSNQVPRKMVKLIHLCLDGQFKKAMEMQSELHDLMKVNFIETNPIPVKAGLAMMGLIEESYRLPLVPMADENRERLRHVLKKMGVV